MDQALADMASGLSLVQQGCREISEGITHLKQSLGDAETVEAALDEISDGLTEPERAAFYRWLTTISDRLEAVAERP